MGGVIEVLSGKGDDKLVLPDDKIEAKKKVDELLGKKYQLMATITKKEGEGEAAVEVKETLKISSFDAETGEYVIKGPGDTETRLASATAEVTAVAPVAGG